MSYFIKRILCANYEDYDKYEETSCTLKHWPQMWEPEIEAEKGVYRERMRQNTKTFFMARDETHRVLNHFRNLRLSSYDMNQLARRALISLVNDRGWKIKNYECMKYEHVSPIFRTSLHEDEDTTRDVGFDVLLPAKPKPKKKIMVPKGIIAVKRALIILADENGWQPLKPEGVRGSLKNDRLYKIV